MRELSRRMREGIQRYEGTRVGGWLALSPLLVFLGVYLLSSVLAGDFYKIPVSSVFLVASVWAVFICRG